jgi:N-acetyl-1-D-myo-inositol-2-amino-2-deoxy-alpha-D-glucopyranoside deacetylase
MRGSVMIAKDLALAKALAPRAGKSLRDHELVTEGHGLERSLLLVHAHPDDESISTGATMAKYAAEGARVTLVTCTLGELGEIIPPGLRHLFPDELGQHRIVELARACEALGVNDHRFLGGEGRYRDSGMMGLPDNDDPRCFWQADVEEAAQALAKVIDEVEASVIVTYDDSGYYGHPDHIQAHRVTKRALELTGEAGGAGGTGAGGGGRGKAKLYATAMPRSVLAQAVKLPGDSWFTRTTDLSASVPDDQVTTEIDGGGYLDAKRAAMRAHETQITVDGEYFALSNDFGQRILGSEYYTQLAGPGGPGAPRGPGGPGGPGAPRAPRTAKDRYERDLFAR